MTQQNHEGKTENGQLESSARRDATPRVLRADMYDALQASAEKWGGVGGGWYATDFTVRSWDLERGEGEPNCIFGHAYFVLPDREDADNTLFALPLCPSDSDVAVRRINQRLGRKEAIARVPFADWCAELRIVRGDS